MTAAWGRSVEFGGQAAVAVMREHAPDLAFQHASLRELGQGVFAKEADVAGFQAGLRAASRQAADEKHLIDMKGMRRGVRMLEPVVNRG